MVFEQQQQRKQWLIRLSAIFLLLLVSWLMYWIFIGRFYETTDDAYVSGNQVQVMSQITGKVVTIFAEETDLVKKGQALVALDAADAEIELKEAEARLGLTARQVSQLYKNVSQLKSNVTLQQHLLEKAKEDYQRRLGLGVNKVISREDLQHAKIAVDTAADALALAQHQLASAIDLISNSTLYSHPQVLQAEANVRNAYLKWRRTQIYAPETGYLAKRTVQVGQQVTSSTVLMVIIPLNQVWVDANFKESQLSNFRIGQPVELLSDMYGSEVKYHGHVVGLNAGTGSSFDLLPPQNATGNWIKIVQRLPVRIALSLQQLEKNPLPIGLSMTVTINTHDRKGLRLIRLSENKVVYQTQDYSVDLKQADALIQKILQANAKNVVSSETN